MLGAKKGPKWSRKGHAFFHKYIMEDMYSGYVRVIVTSYKHTRIPAPSQSIEKCTRKAPKYTSFTP